MLCIIQLWLDGNYPANTVFCTDKLPDETGPTLAHEIRTALDKYRANGGRMAPLTPDAGRASR